MAKIRTATTTSRARIGYKVARRPHEGCRKKLGLDARIYHQQALCSSCARGLRSKKIDPAVFKDVSDLKCGDLVYSKVYDNPMTDEGVLYGPEAQKLHREQMQEMQRIAKTEGRDVSAGVYGSLWCPHCKDYTGQQRYITPDGKEMWRCFSCMGTFSRGKHGWLEKYNPRARRAWQYYPGVSELNPVPRILVELNPRPPAEWFNSMMARTRAQYPGAGLKQLQQIVGGIWYGYPLKTREKLIKRYD